MTQLSLYEERVRVFPNCIRCEIAPERVKASIKAIDAKFHTQAIEVPAKIVVEKLPAISIAKDEFMRVRTQMFKESFSRFHAKRDTSNF